jgi:hypothetical protein
MKVVQGKKQVGKAHIEVAENADNDLRDLNFKRRIQETITEKNGRR